jgi:hypothetical protein
MLIAGFIRRLRLFDIGSFKLTTVLHAEMGNSRESQRALLI